MSGKDFANENRTSVSVSLSALGENYRAIEALLSPGVTPLCVIKADAYGHGAVEVGRRLESMGARYFGVASISEGLELRRNLISSPILVLSGIMPWDDLEELADHDLTASVINFETLERIGKFHRASSLKIHVKIDTGMGRLGFGLCEVPELIRRLKQLKQVEIEGLMTHFSSSERHDDYGMKQVRDFGSVVRSFKDNGIEPGFVHMANSAAICTYPEAHFNMVRPGIMLYGSYPDPTLCERLKLRPVMKWSSGVAFVRKFSPGISLSYGRTYVTEKETVVAYIPLGYADGYSRGLSNRGIVLIKGRRCNVVGRVCMDWTFVDVTGVPDVRPGDEVVLLGTAGGETVTADEMAERIGTIPYEVLCCISRRIPRRYVD
ncbi:MAG: Alanine racemase [Syntrophorhabdaceae bacterium PtaU1.Bin034]|nr:MAG: Alanine racemase [Syntrophorhabdaceae bacterium PtaU1.Bin034]